MHSKIAKSVLMLVMVLALVIPVKTVSAEALFNPVTPERETWVAPDGQIFYIERFSYFTDSSSSENYLKGSDLIAPLSSGCNGLTNGVDMYNTFGDPLWTYGWRISWCYDGAKITYLNPQRIVTIYMAGWSFKGEITSNSRGGLNQWDYYHYKTGDMCLIDYGANCAWHVYPTVEQWVYGNGSYFGQAWY